MYAGDEYYGDEVTSPIERPYAQGNKRPYAAFQSEAGELWVSRWFEGDKDAFTDQQGHNWTRITNVFYAYDQGHATIEYDAHLL